MNALMDCVLFCSRENFTHERVVFNDNGTMTSVPTHPLTWVPELSEGRSENDTLILPNIALLVSAAGAALSSVQPSGQPPHHTLVWNRNIGDRDIILANFKLVFASKLTCGQISPLIIYPLVLYLYPHFLLLSEVSVQNCPKHFQNNFDGIHHRALLIDGGQSKGDP